MVDDQAENCIIVIPGANADLTPADVRRAAEVIQQCDAVLCQLETPLATAEEAFSIARQAGVRTILTPAPVMDLSDEFLQLCDVCVPNRTEMEVLVGMKVDGLDSARTAATRLISRGVKSVALTLGSGGALVVEQADAVHIPRYLSSSRYDWRW